MKTICHRQLSTIDASEFGPGSTGVIETCGSGGRQCDECRTQRFATREDAERFAKRNAREYPRGAAIARSTHGAGWETPWRVVPADKLWKLYAFEHVISRVRA